MELSDLNADGRTELAYRRGENRDLPDWGGTQFNVVAWDGHTFQQLIQTDDGDDTAGGGNELDPVSRFDDPEGDGIKELLVYTGVGSGYWLCGMYPQRGTTATWRWDGEHYVLQREAPDPPRYSYQAVEDGDRLAALGYFEEAILSYLRAISDKSLNPGTPAYWRVVGQPNYCMELSLPTPEIDRGSIQEAYARYRLLLVRAALGQTEAAEASYNALVQRFPMARPGHSYAQMAEAFWLRLQGTNDLRAACGSAIDFAAAHADQVLDPLGYGVNGAPEDLCPLGR
jgi:tetratricopeptide (TPR) repeat protein